MKNVTLLLASIITTQILLLFFLLPLGRDWGILGVVVTPTSVLLGATTVVLLLSWLRNYHRRTTILREWEEGLEKVSHDFRTPIGSLVLLAQRGGQGERDPWNLVQRNAEWMRLLLERQLDLRALRKGSLLLKLESVVVVVAVADVATVFNVLENSLTPRILTVGSQECRVLADSVRLKQVLFNLVENAVKYSLGGVLVSWEENPGSRVRLTVKDEGPGLPKEFTGSFLKGTSSQTPSWVLGSGVGLRLASEILSSHGSELHWVPSERGTVWTWELPAAEAPAPGESGRRPKVVLVDDDALYARLFSEHAKEVADVFLFLKVDDFLAQLAALPAPDLILADYHLGGGKGTKVLDAARTRYGANGPKLVLFSNISDERLEEISRGRSLDGSAVKPMTPAEIKSSLQRLLS